MKPARIALVSVAAARALDEDLAPLLDALRATGAEADVADWDDDAVDWSRYDLALLRSTWDYAERLPEFLAWAERAAARTRLLNPPDVLRWNTDKHYLAELERAGVAIVPSRFVEPGDAPDAALDAFLSTQAREFVVKPAVGAGSRDAQRYGREERTDATAHAARLLDAGRSVLLQPYLDRVDEHGETALIHFDGVFSHAIRKGPLLRRGDGPTAALFAAEQITPRVPDAEERALAQRALAAIAQRDAGTLLYARVDLIRDDDGAPRLLELELAEPSLFFAHAPGSAERFAQAILARTR
ncbi:ATP-grasp domain-containing protein [Dokdonella ginsengisoli]|uniref:RimK family alpha-L-glutamate ligase n=1 Tax=Dokdonella ginsengisoli TaxID=363846 RepID=A0ABV9QZL1_9GAMM